MRASCLLLVAVTVWSVSATAGAAEFRVENRVFRGDNGDPLSRTTTIFAGGQVYDTLTDDGTITVWEPAEKRFTLIDPAREIQTHVTAESLSEYEVALRERCLKRPEAALRFLAEPSFKESFDAASGKLELASQWLTYKCQTQPSQDPAAVAQFVQFSGWTARLNVMLAPQRMPPFGRLVFDKALAARGVLPEQIEMECVVAAPGGSRQLKLRSEHEVSFELQDADRQRVAEIVRLKTTAGEVSFADYRGRAEHRP